MRAKRQESSSPSASAASFGSGCATCQQDDQRRSLPAQTNFDATPKDCRQQAERALNPLDKEHWLKIAEEWLKLAQDAGTDLDPKRASR
jgi:hypothetical protein